MLDIDSSLFLKCDGTCNSFCPKCIFDNSEMSRNEGVGVVLANYCYKLKVKLHEEMNLYFAELLKRYNDEYLADIKAVINVAAEKDDTETENEFADEKAESYSDETLAELFN